MFFPAYLLFRWIGVNIQTNPKSSDKLYFKINLACLACACNNRFTTHIDHQSITNVLYSPPYIFRQHSDNARKFRNR